MKLKLIYVLIFSVLFISPSHGRKVKLNTHDKIFLITHPLMMKATVIGLNVNFTWSEPHQDFSYYLQIFREGNPKPIGTMKVQGRSKALKFKKEKKKLYWRVFAKSRQGNITPNKKRFLIPL